MTHMSAAALPPVQPPINDRDRTHPLWPVYSTYRNSMTNQLVQASSFRDWLARYESDQRDGAFLAHPQYSDFMDWIRTNQGGARKCCPTDEMPYGLSFPANFEYWLNGGRW